MKLKPKRKVRWHLVSPIRACTAALPASATCHTLRCGQAVRLLFVSLTSSPQNGGKACQKWEARPRG